MIFFLEHYLQSTYYELTDMAWNLRFFHFNVTGLTDRKIIIKTSNISYFFINLSMLYFSLSNNTTFDLYKHLLQITQK